MNLERLIKSIKLLHFEMRIIGERSSFHNIFKGKNYQTGHKKSPVKITSLFIYLFEQDACI